MMATGAERVRAATARPLVTVLVTCYNYGRFLGQCLDSVLAQEGVNVRIIVVDDASTDNSVAVATAYTQRDARVELIALPQNQGMIPAVNLGLRHVGGDYVMKLDADDMLPAGSLARSVALLEAYPNLGFVYGWARHFTGEAPRCPSAGYPWRPTLGAVAEWLVTRGCPKVTLWRGADWLKLRYRRAKNCIRQPEAVIRCSTLKSVGDYDPALPHTSDLEMWLRLAAVSDVARINGTDQGYYRVHSNSMRLTVNAGSLKDLTGRRDAFLSDALTSYIRNVDGEDLEEAVRKELALQALADARAEYDTAGARSPQVDQLVEFAVSTYPAIQGLPQWRALQRLGQRRWSVAALADPVRRYLRHEFEYFRWMRTGV